MQVLGGYQEFQVVSHVYLLYKEDHLKLLLTPFYCSYGPIISVTDASCLCPKAQLVTEGASTHSELCLPVIRGDLVLVALRGIL